MSHFHPIYAHLEEVFCQLTLIVIEMIVFSFVFFHILNVINMFYMALATDAEDSIQRAKRIVRTENQHHGGR